MSRALFLRMLVGLLGLVFVILTLWVGGHFHLGMPVTLVIMLAFALATFFAEIIIALENLEKRLKIAFPSLELSLAEQVSVNETIDIYNKLKKNHAVVSTRIALTEFENIHKMLSQAEKGSDYVFHDIYVASMILLGALEPGQTFKVVSNLTKRFYWRSGRNASEHSDLNFRQASRGVIIERIFALNKSDDLEEITSIMKEQKDHGIDVYYIYKDDIESALPYASFAISEEQETGIISHREDILGKVTVTSNSELVTDLATRFEDLKARAVRI